MDPFLVGIVALFLVLALGFAVSQLSIWLIKREDIRKDDYW